MHPWRFTWNKEETASLLSRTGYLLLNLNPFNFGIVSQPLVEAFNLQFVKHLSKKVSETVHKGLSIYLSCGRVGRFYNVILSKDSSQMNTAIYFIYIYYVLLHTDRFIYFTISRVLPHPAVLTSTKNTIVFSIDCNLSLQHGWRKINKNQRPRNRRSPWQSPTNCWKLRYRKWS